MVVGVDVPTEQRPYHHGDLRRALIAAAVDTIAREGIPAVSLRALARGVGVSHAAPAHHFGDKAGLLTAVAVEGFELLAAALQSAWEETGSFLEIGVAYVRFATTHVGHFDVMFRPKSYISDDPAVVEARRRAASMLYGKVPEASGPGQDAGDALMAGIAAWALVHGVATLWVNGALPADAAGDPAEVARTTASFLFRR